MNSATFQIVKVSTLIDIPQNFPRHICYYTEDLSKYYIWRNNTLEEVFSLAAGLYEPTIDPGTISQYWRGDKTWQTLDQAAVGLGLVENTALSTWAGSTNITTLGTISSGVWNGSAINDSYISSASTWNAKIGGSGQNNYIAKFTPDGTTIGDSQIIDDGSTLGIGSAPNSTTKFVIASALSTTLNVVNSLSGGAGLFVQSTGAGNSTNTGLKANASGSTVFNYAFSGQATSTTVGTNIGALLTATNGANNYSLQLQDGTHTVAGRFLKNMTTNGLANWANITAADVSGVEPTITVGTTSQYWRGDKTWQTLNTTAVAEGTNLYFTETRSRATALTGLTVAGGTITSTDSILSAFGKLQNQLNAVASPMIYQGTWNASTNSPTLVSSTGTKGYVYRVTTSGSTNIDGTTDWKSGDFIVYNGATWDKWDTTDAVTSVNGYTGAVTLVKADVGLSNVENTALSTWAGTTNITTLGTIGTGVWQGTAIADTYISSAATWNAKQDALTIGNLTESTSSVLTITGGTGAVIGSGLSVQVKQASGSQSGYLSSTDWTTFNNKGTGTVTSVGLSMPAAFTVSNSPVTSTGTLTVIGAGTTSDYIRGDGTLATFPTSLPTSNVKHAVKYGVALTIGQAVYVSSADGTNMIVSKADNSSEATSSKTIGLVTSTGAANYQGEVITEGLLAGLDTSTATVGDVVWLGTNGNLIFWHYGLTTKPVAPAHLVFIGIVTRVSANNGEIFVKPQNGFEIDELHDVSVVGRANNTLLGYNSATSLHEFKTVETWLGYTPANITLVEPTITAGTTSQYWRGDKTWQTLNTTAVTEGTSLYFTEARTIASILTGLTVTGGTISSADSVLSAFGKLQNQLNAVASPMIYQGTWNASTNSPTLTSSTGTKGHVYRVTTSGSTNIDGITDWKSGDFIVYNGTTWDKWDSTDAVTSINGYTGAVTLVKADVGLGNVENTALSTWAGSTNITTLGTIGTGVWQGTAIGDSYISSASTWNAKVGGSGTLNYLAKFTAAGTIGNSAVFESGGNVGIGTTPTAKLDVNGIVKFNHNGTTNYTLFQNDNEINTYTSAGGAGAVYIQWTGGGVANLGHNNLIVNSNTTGSSISGVTITASANVGLGTATPSAKLHINNVGTGNSFLVEDDTNPDTTSFVIDTNGNVGMGTLTPQTVLHVKANPSSTQTATVRLESAAVSANSSISHYSGGVNRWEVGTGISLGAPYEIYDRVAGQTRFQITTSGASVFSNGNVGIGTTTPGANLEVYGVADSVALVNSAGNSYLKLKRGILNADAHISFDTTTTQKHIVGLINNSDSLIVGGTEASPVIAVNGSNVGIGTLTPGAKLDVNGNVNLISSTSTKINIESGVGVRTYLASDGAGTSFGSLSNHDVVLYRNNSEFARQTATGLGIGTTAPSTKLEVNGDVKISTITSATTNTNKILVSDSGVVKYRTSTELLSDIGLSNVNNTSDLNKPISTATQTALNLKLDANSSIDALNDVTITSPIVNQFLQWNGSQWINASGSVVNAGPGVVYFLSDISAGFGTYEYMSKTPDGLAEIQETITVNNNTVLIHEYISDVAINKTTIDAGIWEFNLFGYVNTLNASFVVDVYKRTTGGTETLLFSAETELITWTSVDLASATTVQQQFTCNATDKLVVKIYGKTTQTSNVILKLVHSGTANYSHIHTPLTTAHNDIAGLQGGASGEYFHLNSAANTKLLSWQSIGIPNADIQSASTWNSKIGGSGTTDYVSRFTGTSTLGIGKIRDNADTVGIGIEPNGGSMLTVKAKVDQEYALYLVNTGDISSTVGGNGFLCTVSSAAGAVIGGNITATSTSFGNGDATGLSVGAVSTTGQTAIGITAYATGGTNNYALRLQDGTQTVGGGKFLKDVGDGNANWANITVADVSGAQGTLTITTTGTSGAATLVGNTLNIPKYIGGAGGANYVSKFTASGVIGNSIIQDDGTYVGIGTTASSNYKLTVGGTIYGVGSGSGMFGVTGDNSGDAAGTYIGVKGLASKDESPAAGNKYIGGWFSANGPTAYSVMLQDGTEDVAGRFLKNMDTSGRANWANITVSDVSGAQASLSGTGFVKISGTTISYDNSTYAKVGTYTDSYIPRWDSATNTLVSGLVRDNGTTIGIGVAPDSTRRLSVTAASSQETAINTSTSYAGANTGYGIYATVSGVHATDNMGIRTEVSGSSNINYGGYLSATVSTGNGYAYGLTSNATNNGTGRAIGLVATASGTSTSKFSVMLQDGTESVAGRFLKNMDTSGRANWATLSVADTGLTITTTGTSGPATLTGNTLNIPQYSGGGGGSAALSDVLLIGNTTGASNILVNDAQGIYHQDSTSLGLKFSSTWSPYTFTTTRKESYLRAGNTDTYSRVGVHSETNGSAAFTGIETVYLNNDLEKVGASIFMGNASSEIIYKATDSTTSKGNGKFTPTIHEVTMSNTNSFLSSYSKVAEDSTLLKSTYQSRKSEIGTGSGSFTNGVETYSKLHVTVGTYDYSYIKSTDLVVNPLSMDTNGQVANILKVDRDGGYTEIDQFAENIIVKSSDVSFPGISYNQDWSANFVDRSLVDKAYVDVRTAPQPYDYGISYIVAIQNYLL